MTSFWGVGTSIGIEIDSLTLSVWVLSSTGLGSCEGIGASVETPYAATEAEAMASTTTFTPLKKPSIGMLIAAERSSVVG